MATEPSPTAPATRLVDPWRTSPAADSASATSAKEGSAQDEAVEGDHHRELLGGCADLLQHPSAAAPDPSHITS